MTFLAIFLAYAVLFVNGWTDAPNSIATAVSSGAINYKKATYLCGAFNFSGAIFGYLTNLSIAKFVFNLTDFGEHTVVGASIVFLTMTLYGIITYFAGLPSSESHAMLCGIVGVEFAITKSLNNAKKVGDVSVFDYFSQAKSQRRALWQSRRARHTLQLFRCRVSVFPVSFHH